MKIGDLFIIIIIIIIINYVFHCLSLNDFKKKTFPKQTDYFTIDESIELPDVEYEEEIPKIIYKCHRNEESLQNYKKVFQKTEELNPDYKLVYYTDEDIEKFIKDNYSERVYNAYKCINPDYGPAKSDFFRYLLIYMKGGIYLDVKSGPTENLDPLLKKLKGKLALSHWTELPIGYIPIHHIDHLYFSQCFKNSYGEFQNWHIISGKGNPLLGKVIKQVVTNIEIGMKNKDMYNNGHYSVIYMTGPIMYTNIIEKYSTVDNSLILSKNCNGMLQYKVLDHKKIEKTKHYSENKNRHILNNN